MNKDLRDNLKKIMDSLQEAISSELGNDAGIGVFVFVREELDEEESQLWTNSSTNLTVIAQLGALELLKDYSKRAVEDINNEWEK